MDGRLRVRRARRDDLLGVRTLLGKTEAPTSAERKRWRRLVTTLREDLYLAEREEDAGLVGLAVIVYVRGLGPPAAVVRALIGASESAEALLECARARASARGCARLEVQLEGDDDVVAGLLADGWSEGPRTLVRALPA